MDLINIFLENGLLMIEINRPDQLNALSIQVLKELDTTVDKIIEDDNIRGAFIIGNGEKAFIAGADVKELQNLSKSDSIKLSRAGHNLLFKIENCPKPIVGAINGLALGGGLELAMACHFRIASDNAKFGLPEINLGLIPGYGGTQRLIRYVGKGKATELMMTGEFIDSNEAYRLGLINYITSQDQLIIKVKEILGKITEKSPISISKIIKCTNSYYDKNGFEIEINSFGDSFDTMDAKEGIDAFIQKRKANFKGK